MVKPRVDVETTIPSFYHESRTSPDMLARRAWTRRWWDHADQHYSLVTSVAVLDELAAGPADRAAQWLELVGGLPIVAVEPPIADIVQTYIQHKVMPANPAGDALHLALASYHKCDFLATWNCEHLANANKFGHIRRINALLGLFVPAVVTPRELLGGQS